MNRSITLFVLLSLNFITCCSQSPAAPPGTMNEAAAKFLETLSAKQKETVQFTFEDDERYDWHFVPKRI